jgi:hypothetical protein
MFCPVSSDSQLGYYMRFCDQSPLPVYLYDFIQTPKRVKVGSSSRSYFGLFPTLNFEIALKGFEIILLLGTLIVDCSRPSLSFAVSRAVIENVFLTELLPRSTGPLRQIQYKPK